MITLYTFTHVGVQAPAACPGWSWLYSMSSIVSSLLTVFTVVDVFSCTELYSMNKCCFLLLVLCQSWLWRLWKCLQQPKVLLVTWFSFDEHGAATRRLLTCCCWDCTSCRDCTSCKLTCAESFFGGRHPEFAHVFMANLKSTVS